MSDDLIRVDFLVLGSGIAGLRAALGLARHGEVLVVTKDQPIPADLRQALPTAQTARLDCARDTQLEVAQLVAAWTATLSLGRA